MQLWKEVLHSVRAHTRRIKLIRSDEAALVQWYLARQTTLVLAEFLTKHRSPEEMLTVNTACCPVRKGLEYLLSFALERETIQERRLLSQTAFQQFGSLSKLLEYCWQRLLYYSLGEAIAQVPTGWVNSPDPQLMKYLEAYHDTLQWVESVPSNELPDFVQLVLQYSTYLDDVVYAVKSTYPQISDLLRNDPAQPITLENKKALKRLECKLAADQGQPVVLPISYLELKCRLLIDISACLRRDISGLFRSRR